MVVLAAAVSTKSGKAIFSRQFVEISRSRIEGLLAAFPKLMGTGQEHTHIETENVRYVYQPLEDLFVILVTNKTSNILQDLDTLHLFARTVSENCRNLHEEEIRRHAFDLINAFDEIVSLGYRENVNLNQIKTFIEMESHEEKIQEQIARSKELEAKEAAKLKIKQMELARKEAARTGRPMPATGMGRNTFSPMSPPPSDQVYSRPQEYTKPAPVSAAPAKKGMVLSKKSKDDFMDVLKTEDVAVVETPEAAKREAFSTAVATEAIHIIVDEKINVVANRDGGLQSMEVKGELVLKIADNDKAKVRIVFSEVPDNDSYQFKIHPNVDKKLFNVDGIVALKDQSKPFPVNQSLGVLRWRYTTADEGHLPLTINCWPTPTGDGGCDVNIEYELLRNDLELRDVAISISIPNTGRAPVVNNVEGEYKFDKSRNRLEWILPLIDASNSSGTLEFTAAGDNPSQYFPVGVSFISPRSFLKTQVKQVVGVDSGAPVPFSIQTTFATEEYVIV